MVSPRQNTFVTYHTNLKTLRLFVSKVLKYDSVYHNIRLLELMFDIGVFEDCMISAAARQVKKININLFNLRASNVQFVYVS